jgi:hypothetical protein
MIFSKKVKRLEVTLSNSKNKQPKVRIDFWASKIFNNNQISSNKINRQESRIRIKIEFFYLMTQFIQIKRQK